MVISFGDLPGLKEVEMTVDENQMLHITWNKKVDNIFAAKRILIRHLKLTNIFIYTYLSTK